jgi:catechol 2,3-dioxygenase-like lactoylglutathione lyase family enzyme
MITRLSHATVYVLDQESAIDFYTNKLGFEVRTDARLGDLRWVTVGPKDQPELEIILGEIAPPMFEPEAARQVREVVSKGLLGIGVLSVDDCRATYAELSAKGVTFVQEPAERPYGIEAVLRDDSGNWFSMTERRPMPTD